MNYRVEAEWLRSREERILSHYNEYVNRRNTMSYNDFRCGNAGSLQNYANKGLAPQQGGPVSGPRNTDIHTMGEVGPKKLYFVFNPRWSRPPVVRYDTLAKAEEVAERMAKDYPDSEFFVMEARVHKSAKPKVEVRTKRFRS